MTTSLAAESTDLLDLAGVRLTTLVGEADDSTLDELIRRLFDPDGRDLLTVCAFASSL